MGALTILSYVVPTLAACGIPLLYYLRTHFAGGVCRSRTRIDGRVVIITGANSGIGKATAVDLARRGGRVYMACRDPARGEAALADVIRLSGSHDVHFMQLDLASLASVREFAARFRRAESRLHILINNAGVMQCPFARTADGFEMQIGTNHLGHFLLTNLLLDRLKASGTVEWNSRIVVVSSLGHELPRTKSFDFDSMNSEDGYDPVQAYYQSKLANVLFARELSRRLSGSPVTANSLHPGLVRTELGRFLPSMRSRWRRMLITPILWLVFKTAAQGAQTSIHCAVAPELEGVTGRYFSDCAVKDEAPWAKDDQAAEKLWDLSAELVGL